MASFRQNHYFHGWRGSPESKSLPKSTSENIFGNNIEKNDEYYRKCVPKSTPLGDQQTKKKKGHRLLRRPGNSCLPTSALASVRERQKPTPRSRVRAMATTFSAGKVARCRTHCGRRMRGVYPRLVGTHPTLPQAVCARVGVVVTFRASLGPREPSCSGASG